MKPYHLIFLIILIFDNFRGLICSKNIYYIVAIQRKNTDKNYNNESYEIQEIIDELVNDRMNDIYNIIEENKSTYILDNGEIDEKLEELEFLNLIKRNNGNDNNKKRKFIFINRNKEILNKNIKRSTISNEIEEMVPVHSNLISHLCPISNYFAIRVYLSPETVNKVKNLDNILFVERVVKSQSEEYKYYNLNDIKKNTNWTSVSVQENSLYKDSNIFSHLSLISQAEFDSIHTDIYDNNYYYPSSAGKGINIYFLDEGLQTNHEDYDEYLGTENERYFGCDAKFIDGLIHSLEGKEREPCAVTDYPIHGNAITSAAGGKLFGIAKKANIHMLATDFYNDDEINALEYIAQHSDPNKTIINISRGGWDNYSEALENKINELSEAGYIIFVSAGNNNRDCCCKDKGSPEFKSFSGYEKTIAVGALQSSIFEEMDYTYNKSYYSNFGECISVFAPGDAAFPPVFNSISYGGLTFDYGIGTSFSAPIVSGIAATIMSENPDIKYTSELMRKTLIDMSIKGIIGKLNDSTPNRLVNNGKRNVYSPNGVYHKSCGIKYNNLNCSNNQCCTLNGDCIDSFNEENDIGLCLIGNGCQSEFGFCLNELPKNNITITKMIKKTTNEFRNFQSTIDENTYYTLSTTIPTTIDENTYYTLSTTIPTTIDENTYYTLSTTIPTTIDENTYNTLSTTIPTTIDDSFFSD